MKKVKGDDDDDVGGGSSLYTVPNRKLANFSTLTLMSLLGTYI
jgi:hypothetical protein